MQRSFFYLVKANPPARDEFRSYFERGLVPENASARQIELLRGVSMWATERQARELLPVDFDRKGRARDMGYEIWDRNERTLVADFDDQEQALDFLRGMVRNLSAEAATRRIDSMQLLRLSDEGRSQTVVSEGVPLLALMFANVVAH